MVKGSPVTFRRLSTGAFTGALLLGLMLPAAAQSQPPAKPQATTPAKPQANPQGSTAPAQATPAPAQAPAAPASGQAPAGQTSTPAPEKLQGKTIPGPVQVKPSPIFPTAPEEKRQFEVEFLINYSRREYRPAVAIPAVQRGNATYTTPEEAFISQMSAMRAGDYDWWLNGWNETSRKQIAQRDAEMKRGAAFWRQAWERNLTGKQVNLVERLESGIYVLLVYTITTPAKDNQVEFRSIFVTKNEGGRWVSTQELGSDFLFHHYLEGRNRITRNSDLQPFEERTPAQIAAGGQWQGKIAQDTFFKAYVQGREKVTNVIR